MYIYIYDISSLRVNDLTFILLTWRKWLAPNNASRQQMGFNSVFKGLKMSGAIPLAPHTSLLLDIIRQTNRISTLRRQS